MGSNQLMDAVGAVASSAAASVEVPRFVCGTVTSTSPLQLMLDDMVEVLPFVPLSSAGALDVGDRVVCERSHGTLIVLTRIGGPAAGTQAHPGVVQRASAADVAAAADVDRYLNPAQALTIASAMQAGSFTSQLNPGGSVDSPFSGNIMMYRFGKLRSMAFGISYNGTLSAGGSLKIYSSGKLPASDVPYYPSAGSGIIWIGPVCSVTFMVYNNGEFYLYNTSSTTLTGTSIGVRGSVTYFVP